MKQETHSIVEQFVERNDNLFALPLPRPLRVLFDYYEYEISSDLGIQGKLTNETKRNLKSMLSEQLVSAIKSMNKQERANHYVLISDYVFMFVHGKMELSLKKSDDFQFEGYVKSNSGSSWKKKIVTYDHINHIISITDPTSLKSKSCNLAYYLYRVSKNQDYKGFVLEACDKRVSKQSRIIHIGFKQQQKFDELFSKVKDSINYRQWQLIKAMYQGDATTKNSVNSMRKQSFQISKANQVLFQQNQTKRSIRKYSLCEMDKQNFINWSNNENPTKKADILSLCQESTQKNNDEKHQPYEAQIQRIFVPAERISDWMEIEKKQSFSIMKRQKNEFLLRMSSQINLQQSFQRYLDLPSNQIEDFTHIDQYLLKINVKKYSKLLRNRIFVVKKEQIWENTKATINFTNYHSQNEENDKNYVLGSMNATAIFTSRQHSTEIEIKLEMMNEGNLSLAQNQKLSIKYLKGIVYRFTSFSEIKQQRQQGIVNVEIQRQKMQKDIQFSQIDGSVKILFDGNACYRFIPSKKQRSYRREQQIIQKLISSEWVRDNQNQLKFTNQTLIDAHKGVFKFVISKMGRNIISGKSILNISLPVEIFSNESNIDRLLHSFRVAPQLFQGCQDTQNLKKLELAGIFTISTSLLYLSQQKSFNPILGQTAQMWIDGCPAYAEQISHHPPIAGLYFVGRGYKIYGSLQSKVELHLNSGTGSNNGPITIQFDNGQKIVNFFPGGEVSGMTYGDRKFRISGKSYHIFESTGEYLQINYDNSSNGIFSSSKQKGITGKYYKADPRQLEYFLKNKKFIKKDKHIPFQNSISGSWHGVVTNHLKQNLINFETTCPCRLSRDSNPLPSDSLWREDIAYRRLQNLQKAQQFKQILQQKQRKDRKLRGSHQ